MTDGASLEGRPDVVAELTEGARKALSSSLLVGLKIKTLTPIRVGGYRGTPYDSELGMVFLPDGKAVKGVWRWWARVAMTSVTGAADYRDAEEVLGPILGDTSQRSRVSITVQPLTDPTDEILKKKEMLDEFYGRFIELVRNNPADISVDVSNPLRPSFELRRGSPGQSANAIKEVLGGRVEWRRRGGKMKASLKIQPPNGLKGLERIVNVPRVKLLLMPRTEEGEISKFSRTELNSEGLTTYLRRVKEELSCLLSTEGFEFRLKAFFKGGEDEEKFLLSTLLLSLLLGGLGSITRRGFGSLAYSVEEEGALVRHKVLSDYYRKLESDGKAPTAEEIEKSIKGLVKEAIDGAARLARRRVVPQDIPSVPALSNMRIRVKESGADLLRIGNAFMKVSWKLYPREHGEEYHTWILGLPRMQKGKGYYYESRDVERRISAIGARVYKKGGRRFVLLYGFLSKDWKVEKLRWKGKYSSRRVKELDVKCREGYGTYSEFMRNVFDCAFDYVYERL